MIDADTIQKAVDVLLATAPSGSEVILFGSYARGDATEDSDLDFMVVEPAVPDRRAEWARLREALSPLRVPVDLLVVSRGVFDAWRGQINNVIHEAAREGHVYAPAAA